MPQSLREVLRHLSAPQRKVIEAVALLASITLSEINPSVRMGSIIENIKQHDGISKTRVTLDELVERGVLVKEVREGSSPQFKFSKAVMRAGGFQWIVQQLAMQNTSYQRET